MDGSKYPPAQSTKGFDTPDSGITSNLYEPPRAAVLIYRFDYQKMGREINQKKRRSQVPDGSRKLSR